MRFIGYCVSWMEYYSMGMRSSRADESLVMLLTLSSVRLVKSEILGNYSAEVFKSFVQTCVGTSISQRISSFYRIKRLALEYFIRI